MAVAVMGVAILSVLSGVEKGVRRLSELNLILAVCLCCSRAPRCSCCERWRRTSASI
ncbi:BCCT family transporter [Brevundimonas sp. SORGH_AS_0993]|uniref:BCCT family transporter n=1 Tax=Brevundimonas sp. SORGH_AS_0993 TaxID=3041794 RepID=UPI00277D187E|nr:BCCT family transporter [Brevundimonas sp. SORGH_AS_0993]MDQ1155288.1 hypothetical protein [Brevundimonas sp. SORGH_AS_0993]